MGVSRRGAVAVQRSLEALLFLTLPTSQEAPECKCLIHLSKCTALPESHLHRSP